MLNLDSFVPDKLRVQATKVGNEWLYPIDAVSELIRIADERDIAILGVELFRIVANGLQTEAMSSYEVPFDGNWNDFVRKNNALASEFVHRSHKGQNGGYILTSVNETEFADPTRK